MFRFVVMGDTRKSTRILPQGDWLVGSATSCDVVIDDPSVAPCHAVIRSRDDVTLLPVDGGAVTAIGARPLTDGEEAPLPPGVVVTFGNVPAVIQANDLTLKIRL